MSENTNFIAPVGEMSMDFKAPSNYEQKEKRTDIQNWIMVQTLELFMVL